MTNAEATAVARDSASTWSALQEAATTLVTHFSNMVLGTDGAFLGTVVFGRGAFPVFTVADGANFSQVVAVVSRESLVLGVGLVLIRPGRQPMHIPAYAPFLIASLWDEVATRREAGENPTTAFPVIAPGTMTLEQALRIGATKEGTWAELQEAAVLTGNPFRFGVEGPDGEPAGAVWFGQDHTYIVFEPTWTGTCRVSARNCLRHVEHHGLPMILNFNSSRKVLVRPGTTTDEILAAFDRCPENRTIPALPAPGGRTEVLEPVLPPRRGLAQSTESSSQERTRVIDLDGGSRRVADAT